MFYEEGISRNKVGVLESAPGPLTHLLIYVYFFYLKFINNQTIVLVETH